MEKDYLLFSHVSVHVRRTDKVGTEAAFHSLEEYMVHVGEYYDYLELKQTVDKRRIYLASDDPKVIQEAVNKYPNYEILGDPFIAKTAAVKNRYSQTSLFGIIFDIHMLSMSDYLVCTFSSQVSIYEYDLKCLITNNIKNINMIKTEVIILMKMVA